MKILQSISKIYNEQRPFLEKLKEQVDRAIISQKRPSWHYYSRIKSEESFALKLETGRVRNARQMEDFFACTLVVENIGEIANAIKYIESILNIKRRRPESDDATHKQSFSFEFDDLRLYVSLRKVEYLEKGELDEIEFELQIKTFLQHAWSIATHDLIYKSDDVSWSKARVAFQVKAMLEQAELAISGVDALSKLPELNKMNQSTLELIDAKQLLVDIFPRESLPKNLIRLCTILVDIKKIFELDFVTIREIIQLETEQNRGAKTLDLSPYAIIIQSILNQRKTEVERIFKNGNKLRSKGILFPDELHIPTINIEDDSKIVRF